MFATSAMFYADSDNNDEDDEVSDDATGNNIKEKRRISAKVYRPEDA